MTKWGFEIYQSKYIISESFALVPLVIAEPCRVHLALIRLVALSLDLLLRGSCIVDPCQIVVHCRVHVSLVVNRSEGSRPIVIHGRRLSVT